MNRKYVSIILTVCLVLGISLNCTACKQKEKQHIVIQYKSKYSQLTKTKTNKNQSSVINLSDGNKINYDYRVGPSDPVGPSFNLVTVDNQ